MYYSPVRHSLSSKLDRAFDLHVLGTPPAFILSQDQTLHLIWLYYLSDFYIRLSYKTIDVFVLSNFPIQFSKISALSLPSVLDDNNSSFRFCQQVFYPPPAFSSPSGYPVFSVLCQYITLLPLTQVLFVKNPDFFSSARIFRCFLSLSGVFQNINVHL